MKLTRTNKHHYNEMLEILPPAAITHGRDDNGTQYSAFLVGEPADHRDGVAVYASFFTDGDQYYTGENMTQNELYDAIRDIETLQNAANEAEDIDGHNGDILDAYDNYDEAIVEAFAYCFGWDYVTRDAMDEAYSGQYDSDEEFAQDMAEQMGDIKEDIQWPHSYIDWERAARDLMYDYCEHDGCYFRNV